MKPQKKKTKKKRQRKKELNAEAASSANGRSCEGHDRVNDKNIFQEVGSESTAPAQNMLDLKEASMPHEVKQRVMSERYVDQQNRLAQAFVQLFCTHEHHAPSDDELAACMAHYMAACKAIARDDEDDKDHEQATHESDVATYLSLWEQKLKELSKALDAARSQAEKEEIFWKVFHEHHASLSDKKMGRFLHNSEGEYHEKWHASINQHLVVLSTLAQKHGCKHIETEYEQSQVDKMQPGSGLRMQPLNDTMCANCTPTIKNGFAVCEKRGIMVCSGCRLVKYCSKRCQKKHWSAHKADCKSPYAETDWLEGSRYDMTAKDASGERMSQIGDRRFLSKAIQFPLSASSLPTPCSACLAESGDLSDMVHTILSVPDGYEGEITLHLNHPSPNIAFCNLLSLLAMGTIGELSCDMLIQLWYSVAMTGEQMHNITIMLRKLVDYEGEVTKGPYCASLPKLPQVTLAIDLEPKHWVVMFTENTLQSPRHIRKCMEDRHKHLFSPQGKKYAVEMLTTLSPHQRVSWDNFAQLGMLLPLRAFNAHHNVQNPFLFDVDNRWRPESQLDPLQCWSRDETIAAGEECGVPINDIYGALFFLIRRKLSACIQKLSKHRFHIVVTCCEPSALVHRLQQSKTPMHYISGVDSAHLQYTHSDDQELSIRALKKIIQDAGLSLEGCLEKSDLVARAALILGRGTPSNGKDSTAADTSLPPTQQPDNADDQISFIEARASLDPPDMLAVRYLAELGKIQWMEKGVEKSIPECLALYGWLQLCSVSAKDALSALSHLKRAKDMKNANGLLFWGLIMENAYGDATDTRSEAWTCYHESACLGNHAAMFNVAHILAARGDHKQAVGWWKKAMQHGPSLFELYRCYHHGHGCTQDNLEAREYLLQAAYKGYGPACATLSEWYGSGWENVLRKNPKKKEHWHKQATISSEKHPYLIYTHPLRSLTNATPAWWRSLRAVVELMEPNGGGTKAEDAEVGNMFDTMKFGTDGADIFMMEMNPTPSNGGVIGDVGPPHQSFLLRAESLALTLEERLQLQGIVQEITDILTSSKVIASVEVCGSYGKGTAVSGCADLDMVATTVKCFESDMYLSLQRHAATLLKDHLQVDLKYKPLAVSFTYKHVEIDVVLASPNIEPISLCYLPPRPRYFRRPSLSVKECAFLHAQPPLFGAVVRLLKKWRASAENWPHGCKPRSFLLELIALAAIQKVDASQFTEETIRDGFVTSLELLLQVISGSLKLFWVDNYPEYSIEFENHDGPIVMDLFDPTNNLAGLLQIQDWRPLSQLAEQTLIAIRDHNLVQRVIHITPTTEQSVSAISPQYRFSCFVLRAEQLMNSWQSGDALDAMAAASQIDSSNLKLRSLWHECITQSFAEKCEAKRSSLTEAELLSQLKDAVVDAEQVSRFEKEVKKMFAQTLNAPSFVSRDMGACKEMDIPFSTYMRSHHEADCFSSEEDDNQQIENLFPDPSEDKLCTPLITSAVWTSAFKDGMYSAWLMLRQLTDKMPSKEQRDMYTRASLQSVLAYDALCVGKDVFGLDRMTASILATAQTTILPELHALVFAAAKRVIGEASSEMQVLPHCGLCQQVAASIVIVHIHVMRQAWAKAREALKPLLKRDDLWNRADVCYFIGSSLLGTGDTESAMLWHEQGIKADPTFRINLWALGHAMLYAKSTVEADPKQKTHIMKNAEKHLWQYIEQGVPEDKLHSDALYELVLMSTLSLNFQEAHRRLEKAIDADIRRTQIYNEPSDNRAKQYLMVIATSMKQFEKVKGCLGINNPENILFFDMVQKMLCENLLLITVDCARKLKNVSCLGLHYMKEHFSQKMATSFWSGKKSEWEFAAKITKNLTRGENNGDNEGDVKEEQAEKQKGMQQIVVDCEGSGDFLTFGEALRSGFVTTGTVITMKGGTYKEKRDLCISHEHLTIQAASSKEKVIIQSYAEHAIRLEANHVTLSGLSVDLLSPKGHDGIKELRQHAIYIRAGTAVVLENCSATSATGAAICVGDSSCSSEIEVTMVMCNARASVSSAIICAGSRTQLKLQQCNASHSLHGLEVRTGATARVRSSHFSCNTNAGVLVWQHASAETVIGPDNVIQDNQGSGAMLCARDILFHRNKVTGNKLFGVTVQPDPAPGFKDVEVKVEDCTLSQNGWGGVQFCVRTCGVISGCRIKKNDQCGIMVGMGVEKLSITGNRIQGNYSLQETGIVMLGRAKVADDNKFSNNRMTLEKPLKSNEHHQSRHASAYQIRYENLIAKQMAPHLFGRLRCAKCGVEGGPHKKMVPCVKCHGVAYCSMQCLKADVDRHQGSCDPVPFYETVEGTEITFDVEHLQHMQAERDNTVCSNCDAIIIHKHLMKCAACKCAAYCSRECQEKHWPVHKTVCKCADTKSHSKETNAVVSLSSSFVSVKATTQHSLEAERISRRCTGDAHIGTSEVSDSSVMTRIVDPVGVLQLSSDVVPVVIKIYGSEDDLIKKDTFLQFCNEDRSVSGWIVASMNTTGEFKDAYTLICDTIMQFGDAGRLGGKKGYFEAVIQRNMEVKVNCGNLVTENIEW